MQGHIKGDVLVMPILGKYKPNEEFSVLLGAQLDYILEEGIKRLGIRIAIGLLYDVTKHFLIALHYSYRLTNRIEDIEDFDFKFSSNFFQLRIVNLL